MTTCAHLSARLPVLWRRRVVECASAQHLYAKYSHLSGLLADRERAVYDEWQAGVTGHIRDKLRLPLITRHKDTVEVNFDPQVGVMGSCRSRSGGTYLLYFPGQSSECAGAHVPVISPVSCF